MRSFTQAKPGPRRLVTRMRSMMRIPANNDSPLRSLLDTNTVAALGVDRRAERMAHRAFPRGPIEMQAAGFGGLLVAVATSARLRA